MIVDLNRGDQPPLHYGWQAGDSVSFINLCFKEELRMKNPDI
jgi:hypothetical protein